MSAYVPIRTVALCDGGIGKTTMYLTYNTEQYPDHYIPTIDNYCKEYDLNGIGIYLAMIDTAQRTGIDPLELRPLVCPESDVFISCFDFSSQRSKDRVSSYWVPEFKRHWPTVSIILVATKIHLRDVEQETVTTKERKSLAAKIGAAKYVEISSLRNEGLKELFSEVFQIGNEHYSSLPNKRLRKCSLL